MNLSLHTLIGWVIASRPLEIDNITIRHESLLDQLNSEFKIDVYMILNISSLLSLRFFRESTNALLVASASFRISEGYSL